MELYAQYMVIPVVTESGENVLPKSSCDRPYFIQFLYLDDLDRAFQCHCQKELDTANKSFFPSFHQEVHYSKITELMTELDLLYRSRDGRSCHRLRRR